MVKKKIKNPDLELIALGGHHIHLDGTPAYGQRFFSTRPFSEDLAVVEVIKGEKEYQFHIKPNGKPAYKERFGIADDFSEGLARVKGRRGGWFHIKPDGQPAYTKRFIDVANFSEGLATVIDEDDYDEDDYDEEDYDEEDYDEEDYIKEVYFHILPDGTPAYKERFCRARGFSEGLAVVKDFGGGIFHIKPNGEHAYEPWKGFNRASDFVEGLACVEKGIGWYHINPNGTPAYGERFRKITDFSSGIALAEDENNKSFYITKDGKKAFKKKFNQKSPFSEGLAAVKDETGAYHIRPDGEPAYEERFWMVESFSEGLAVVVDKKRGRYHIRPDGTDAYKQRYHSVDSFVRGLANITAKKKNITKEDYYISFSLFTGLSIEAREIDQYVITKSGKIVKKGKHGWLDYHLTSRDNMIFAHCDLPTI